MVDDLTTALPRVPYDEGTEAALIASVLHAPHLFPGLDLPPEAFYVPRHRHFWRAFMELDQSGVGISEVTVRDVLRNWADPEHKEPSLWQAMSGEYYLDAFARSVTAGDVNPLEAEGYASLLHRDRQRRLVYGAAQAVLYEAARNTDLNRIMALLHEQWASLNIAQRVALRPFSEFLTEYYDYLARLRAGTEVEQIISSPWADLDYLIGGAEAGDLMLVGAPPSRAKSTFLWQWAVHVARLGKKALFFSLEMTGRQMSKRSIAQDMGLTTQQQRDLDDQQWGALTNWIGQALDDYQNIQLYALSQKLILPRLLGLVEQAHQRGEVDMIFLDYLQLVEESERHYGNRTLEIENITQALLDLAIRLELPVLMAAQLNDTGEEPTLSDFRWGGGGAAQAPTKIMALHRLMSPEEYDAALQQGVKKIPTHLYVLKNRNGPISGPRVELTFDLTRMKLTGEPIHHIDLEVF